MEISKKHIMKLVNSILINRPAKTVWAFLENPANMMLWNPKVIHVSPSSFSAPQLGYRYAITYQMHERARASEFIAEFVHFEPFLKLVTYAIQKDFLLVTELSKRYMSCRNVRRELF